MEGVLLAVSGAPGGRETDAAALPLGLLQLAEDDDPLVTRVDHAHVVPAVGGGGGQQLGERPAVQQLLERDHLGPVIELRLAGPVGPAAGPDHGRGSRREVVRFVLRILVRLDHRDLLRIVFSLPIGHRLDSSDRLYNAVLAAAPVRAYPARLGMSFSIERYKKESRKLDTTGVEWDRIRDHPLSKGDLFFLHYAMDVENHVPLYLSHLLVTRACMNPVITTFLSLWAYEELWHGENLSRFLVEYGIPLENDTRIRNLRSDMGVSNSLSILSTMLMSWALDDFAALYLSIGACNELSTTMAYGALARNCEHPVLRDLLGRIQKDERRHFAFYYNSAKEWMTDNPTAQRVDRFMLEHIWVPVGKGVKTQEEVDTLAIHLFGDQ